MSDTLGKLFPYLIPAALCLYVGTHVLWRGTGGHAGGRGFARGVLLAMPVGLLAMWFGTRGAGDVGIAICVAASVLMLTLVLGACAMSDPHDGTTSGPSFGLLAPLCAATLFIGYAGELNLTHAIALLVLGIVLAWASPTPVLTGELPVLKPRLLVGGVLLMVLGAAGMAMVGHGLMQLSMATMAGPIILPLLLLASIGLLVGDVHHAQGPTAAQTIGGFVITLLGFAVPGVIMIARARAVAIVQASTQPTELTPLVVPWASWRIDSLVLVIVSVLLLPVAAGRVKLARLEGLLLVLACVVYMSVTVLSVRR